MFDHDEAGFRAVGPHRFRIEPPDVVHVKLNGDVELEHIRVLYASVNELPDPSRAYLLRDARRVGEIKPKAREYLAKPGKKNDVAAVVNYGSSFQARVLLSMVMKAVRIFRPSAPRLVFFETESQARAWIEADRGRRVSRPPVERSSVF